MLKRSHSPSSVRLSLFSRPKEEQGGGGGEGRGPILREERKDETRKSGGKDVRISDTLDEGRGSKGDKEACRKR